ncbi:MAG: sigma-70 family RNA polymerase sigma factor [Tepidisphaeraceae bacterium]
MTTDRASEEVVRALLARSVDRLHMLCAGMLYKRYPRLAQGPVNLQSQDLLSAVIERLIKALRNIRPETVKQFFALANRHMRWELNELARQLDQRMATLELRDSFAVPAEKAPASEVPPSESAVRILQAIERLPEDEREVFGLVRIQGMTQAGAAEVLGISTKTAQRRLHRAVAMLVEELPDLQPPPDGE